MIEYVREKFHYLLEGMSTLDDKFFYKIISDDERKDIMKFSYYDENADVLTREDTTIPRYNLVDFLGYKPDFGLRVYEAVMADLILVIFRLEFIGGVDREDMNILVAYPTRENLDGKYTRAYLLRKIPVFDGGPYIAGELHELYPVYLKASTLHKSDHILLFDKEEEQSFDRLYPYMKVWLGTPGEKDVVQELYEKRNPELFADYKIVDSLWSNYCREGKWLCEGVKKILKLLNGIRGKQDGKIISQNSI